MNRLSQHQWREIREKYLAGLVKRGIELELRDRTWAVTPGGMWVLLAVADERNPDRWLVGFNHDQFVRRACAGVVLLCRSRSGEIIDFGLSRKQLAEIDDRLQFTNARGSREIRLNVRREGSRYLLLLSGREPLDITGTRGSIDWIGPSRAQTVSEAAPPYGACRDDSDKFQRFYARCKAGRLKPLDGSDKIGDGLYLVTVAKVDKAPAISSLRKIASLPASDALPSDLADSHTHYSHGGPKN